MSDDREEPEDRKHRAEARKQSLYFPAVPDTSRVPGTASRLNILPWSDWKALLLDTISMR